MRVLICKAARTLEILDNGAPIYCCRVALGREPLGTKRAEGDGRTPEGVYRVCMVKQNGKYGRSLALDYPSVSDAETALQEARIDRATYDAICLAHSEGRRPPWGTPLGGEIYLHEGGSHSDWTAGCIALNENDMDALFARRDEIEQIEILP